MPLAWLLWRQSDSSLNRGVKTSSLLAREPLGSFTRSVYARGMSKCGQLWWDDVRCVFRLIGEVRELGRNMDAWNQHMLAELSRIIGANVAFSAEAQMPFTDSSDDYVAFRDQGWGTFNEREAWLSSCEFYDDNPTAAWLKNVGDNSFTFPRQVFSTDGRWYDSSYANDFLRDANIDQFLISNRAIHSLRVVHVIQFQRPWGEPAFSEKDIAFVKLFHDELAHLWETLPGQDSLRQLPAYLRRTLNELERGLSEKEIAAELELSPSTVHSYVKTIMRKTQVRSRAQLMARFIRSPQAPWLTLVQ